MMMRRAFRALFPRGTAWTLTGALGALVDGIADSFEVMRQYLLGVLREMFPGTSVDMIDKHYNALGITYTANDTLKRKQERAEQVSTSIGGQSYQYVQTQLNIAYPDLVITEFYDGGGLYNPVCTASVTGSVQATQDVQRANDILRRTAPAQVVFIFDTEIDELDQNAESGRAMSGLMQSGRAFGE